MHFVTLPSRLPSSPFSHPDPIISSQNLPTIEIDSQKYFVIPLFPHVKLNERNFPCPSTRAPRGRSDQSVGSVLSSGLGRAVRADGRRGRAARGQVVQRLVPLGPLPPSFPPSRELVVDRAGQELMRDAIDRGGEPA